jgi:hypothetical protein
MRELVIESRACGVCGAGMGDGGGVYAAEGGGTFFHAEGRDTFTAVPRERSGVAHAAGFAGVLFLFRYSFMPLALSGWWPAAALGTWLMLLFSLLAPLALALAFAAGMSLDRSPEKSGKLPALFGLLVGWLGTYSLVFLLDSLWQRLASGH